MSTMFSFVPLVYFKEGKKKPHELQPSINLANRKDSQHNYFHVHCEGSIEPSLPAAPLSELRGTRQSRKI